MSLFQCTKYKIIIDPDSRKMQGLRAGDVVRRQYFDNPNLVYSLMIVLETGTDVILGKDSHFFIGALAEGDEPKNGELLDFVRVTNLFDNERGGAMYLTASDAESPYLDVIDGLARERSLYLSGGVFRIEGGERFDFLLNDQVSYPERIVVWYRIRASKTFAEAPLTLGYADGSETDGSDTVGISTEWQYKLSFIGIDFPARYDRKVTIAPPLTGDDWCEVTDVNVIRLSSLATFADATKARVGKVTGIIDPVFGVLEGYGAYFQHLYATKNVNIAGTLTAGDEKGFASTFYVGKIHKNVVVNSIACSFSGAMVVSEPAPVGIGRVVCSGGSTQLAVQSSAWRESHVGQRYCFSLWVKAETGTISVFQDEHYIGNIEIKGSGEWQRYRVLFGVKPSTGDALSMRFESSLNELFLCAPQMESGENCSQYQPTDETLFDTEDYGAWFSKGGIGGTIQNPLLKLNEDGSVSSRNGSFVIKPDGTGYFANGKFSWTNEDIVLKDMSIRWGEMDEETQDNLLSHADTYSIDIISDNGNSFLNGAIATSLTAHVFKGSEEITDSLPNNLFNWKRVSQNAEGDVVWNELHIGFGKTLTLTGSDVYRRATFSCEVQIN